MSQKLLCSLTLLLLTGLLRAQAFERTYQLPSDTLYTVDSLAETDDNYFVYLSQGQQTDRLAIDKLTGEQESFGSYTAAPEPCVDTAGTSVGGSFYVRARATGANRVLIERVERTGACNSGAITVVEQTTVEVPGVDTVAVSGVAYDRSSSTVYVAGGSSTYVLGNELPVLVQQYALGLSAVGLEQTQISQSVGFEFYVPLLESSIIALKEGYGLYLKGYADRSPSTAIFYSSFSENTTSKFEVVFTPDAGVCAYDAQSSFANYIEVNYTGGCYSKCDSYKSTVYVDYTEDPVQLPFSYRCQAGPILGSSVDVKFASSDTGVVFAGTTYGVGTNQNQLSKGYYQKLGTDSDWTYFDDSTSTFRPDPVGLGTSDGGAIFVEAKSGGVLRLRKFDGRGRLSAPRVDIAISDLRILDDTLHPTDVLFFNFELDNFGDLAAEEDFIILAYISADTVLDDSDLQEGRVETGNIAAGEVEFQVPGASTLPQDIAPGDYTLFVVADARNVYPDEDKANNVISAPFVVRGDTGTVGLNAFAELGIAVGPNPTAGPVHVRLPDHLTGSHPYNVLDAQGRVTLAGQVRSGNQTLDLSSLAQGIHTLLIPDLRASVRLVKQ